MSIFSPPEWQVYRGECDKKFYDLRLHGDSLTIYHECWPNNGKFYWNDSEISGDMVYKIRETRNQEQLSAEKEKKANSKGGK